MKRLGNLSGLASSAYLIQTEHDLYTAAEWSELENTENAEPVSNYWCIMMARKGDAYGYAIALNAKIIRSRIQLLLRKLYSTTNKI